MWTTFEILPGKTQDGKRKTITRTHTLNRINLFILFFFSHRLRTTFAAFVHFVCRLIKFRLSKEWKTWCQRPCGYVKTLRLIASWCFISLFPLRCDVIFVLSRLVFYFFFFFSAFRSLTQLPRGNSNLSLLFTSLLFFFPLQDARPKRN